LTYFIEEQAEIKSGKTIYFDPGCKTSLTGVKTDGSFTEYDFNPLRKVNLSTYKYIDDLKGRRDKKKRGSNKYRYYNKRIKKFYRKINTRSKAYLHTLANKILKDHQDVKYFRVGNWSKRVTVADTGIKIKDKRINRAVQLNNPIQKLVEVLAYKAQLVGKVVNKFNERGTTRTCSKCNYIHPDGIDPSQRVFKCKKCGFEYGRDHQSCLNFIKRFEPALWQRLPKLISDSSVKVVLAPFSFKPQVGTKQLMVLTSS